MRFGLQTVVSWKQSSRKWYHNKQEETPYSMYANAQFPCPAAVQVASKDHNHWAHIPDPPMPVGSLRHRLSEPQIKAFYSSPSREEQLQSDSEVCCRPHRACSNSLGLACHCVYVHCIAMESINWKINAKCTVCNVEYPQQLCRGSLR